jgi:hypothetical protein
VFEKGMMSWWRSVLEGIGERAVRRGGGLIWSLWIQYSSWVSELG